MRTDHRPFPVPDRRWTWRQTWHDLLFAHWPLPHDDLRPLVPAQLTLQTFDGSAWLGVVPFRMTGVTRRPLPALPWLSSSLELNLRTYVEHGGKPGVWFLSLDASNPAAVWGARLLFHLPYFHARMDISGRDGDFVYRSTRREDPAGLAFAARYAPIAEPAETTAGTLEHWLTARFCLYAEGPDGGIRRTDIHHPPWPLQEARAEIERNELPHPHGLTCEGKPALLHFSRRQDVRVWDPVVAEDAGPRMKPRRKP